MDEEILDILRMVREGQITPEQGAELVAALRSPGAPAPPGREGKPRFVRIKVDVKEEGKDKVAVNVNLPAALADVALKIANQAKITRKGETIALGDYLKDLQGIEISDLLQMVKEGAQGKLVDVDVEEDEQKVKVEVTVD